MAYATDDEIAAAVAAHRSALLDHHIANTDPGVDDVITDTADAAVLNIVERAAFAALIALVPKTRQRRAHAGALLPVALGNLDRPTVARWLATLAR